MFGVFVWLARFLSAFGAIHLGLMAFFDYDLIGIIIQAIKVSNIDKICYGAIGLAGVFSLLSLFVIS